MNDDLLLASALLAEPYRTKMVEKIHLPSRAERAKILADASYAITQVASEDVFIDLMTDSGTGAMSDEQWAGLMRGDEAYMGAKSFARFEAAVREATGYTHVVPTHQGRAAENILMGLLVEPDHLVASNTHFDTTRAHVEIRKAVPLDLVGDALWDFDVEQPFKGDFDLAKLEAALERHGARIPFIVVTVVNNMAASSPVSMANIREVRRLAERHGKPVLFDACRFAENAYFIKKREPGYADRSVADIAREMFSYGDGCWMSAKKDALVNVGGFIALRDPSLARRCQERLVLYEGFPTYGGLAGRDLEAIAVGLREGVDEEYLQHRTRQVAYLGELLETRAGVKVSKPVGGSGVFIDIASVYPHLPAERFPGHTLVFDAYLEGGVRVGACPFTLNGLDPRTGEIAQRLFQFVRLAVPRRVYGKAHLEYVAEVFKRVKERAPRSKGYRRVHAPEVLGNFFATFEPITE